ncbi:MAG: hypothetical protein AB8B55_19235 [Mariniblastus sp.]
MNRPKFVFFLLATAAFVLFTSLEESAAQSRSRYGAQATENKRVIVLEISATGRAQVGTQQKWLEALQDVGADKISIKTKRTGTPKVEETQVGRSTAVVTVTGFIVGNKLKLPGGTFAITNKSGIRELLTRLKDDGAKVGLAEKKAFGLTSEQLVEVHEKFSAPVEFSTTGQKVSDVFAKIVAASGLDFTMGNAARAAINGRETVAEELLGVSMGTALATIVRPLGMVVEPRREQGKSTEILIVDSRASKEHWPIGWPIQRAPVAIEPKLFEKLPINIRNVSLKDAMNAVQKRAGVPFFYDHNTMAREGIELADVKVTLNQDKGSLMVAISKLLRQSKPRMVEELRVDENGKPFLWITVP